MRDEVLIKRRLVAMATRILANKRVGEKCLQGAGKKRRRGGKGKNRRKEVVRAAHSPRPEQPDQRCFSSRVHKGTQVTARIPPLFPRVLYGIAPSAPYPG